MNNNICKREDETSGNFDATAIKRSWKQVNCAKKVCKYFSELETTDHQMYSQCDFAVTIKDSEQNEFMSYVAEKNK